MVMKATIIQTIEILKEKVKNNLYVIQDNQKVIRHWLKQPDSEKRTTELEKKYNQNKELHTENNDFINVQLTLTSFLEKYKNNTILENVTGGVAKNYRNEEECFEMTINGALLYNSDHPYYENTKFFERLLCYFQEKEDYENCSRLVHAKNTN